MSKPKRPGAPKGNTNATRPDGKTRPKLNVRVEPETLEWLRRQAERDGVTVGRWLDRLAYRCDALEADEYLPDMSEALEESSSLGNYYAEIPAT